MRCKGKIIGGVLAASGLVILLSCLLPISFWWMIFGAALVLLGCYVVKR